MRHCSGLQGEGRGVSSCATCPLTLHLPGLAALTSPSLQPHCLPHPLAFPLACASTHILLKSSPVSGLRRVATGQAGLSRSFPVFAVPPGSGRGAHDPGNEPRIGAGGPESGMLSALSVPTQEEHSSLQGGPGHKPTSEEKRGGRDKAYLSYPFPASPKRSLKNCSLFLIVHMR